ncbi:MAG: UDP-N-acetylmuramate--L-alanine ligase [Bacteroidetes bacterium]|nr:UDP-N-acetylmuramate--L-alanine ligase [Bacteroidota bacterium]
MNLNNFHSVYFIGIGGIGMSAIARYFNAIGKSVSGYDKTPSALTEALKSEGINISFEDSSETIPAEILKNSGDVLIVYTPAIPKGHKQFDFFKEKGYTIKKRSEVLGEITKNSYTLAVAGTHGKTTTSSILAHIFKHSGKDSAAFLGGITVNYNSNLILPENKNILEAATIVEADEYDRSFLTLHPDVAIITSMDADHLDVYGEKKYLEESFNLFANQLHKGGKLIFKNGLPLQLPEGITSESYAANEEAFHCAENIRVEQHNFMFDYVSPLGEIRNISFKMPGRHNIENAIAASAAAITAGINLDEIKSALESFRGVKRRFEYIIDSSDMVFIDDYAHHPEELKACIGAVKELYPDKIITGVFQPHLFSRTRDFAESFAKSLDMLDECILLDIYPARENPIEGVSSDMLLDLMESKNKKLLSKEELIKEFIIKKPEVLLILGAGDIDRLVEPIRKELLK